MFIFNLQQQKTYPRTVNARRRLMLIAFVMLKIVVIK
jgi:hypothetical protein